MRMALRVVDRTRLSRSPLGVRSTAMHRFDVRRARRLYLTPRNASSAELFPSDCPPIATISGMGSVSPSATAAAWSRLHDNAVHHSDEVALDGKVPRTPMLRAAKQRQRRASRARE